jgi:hypothetical protein
MTLPIAVQLVGGHADYLVKVGIQIFLILLAPADRTPHKHLTMCSVLKIWFLGQMCDCERNVSPTGNWGSKCGQNIETLGAEKMFVLAGFQGC